MLNIFYARNEDTSIQLPACLTSKTIERILIKFENGIFIKVYREKLSGFSPA
jgi:hypothetical protein